MIKQTHRHPSDEGDILIVEVMVMTETEFHAVCQVMDIKEWARGTVGGKVICTRVHWEDEAEVSKKDGGEDEDTDTGRFRFTVPGPN